jgi:hypothetical protein
MSLLRIKKRVPKDSFSSVKVHFITQLLGSRADQTNQFQFAREICRDEVPGGFFDADLLIGGCGWGLWWWFLEEMDVRVVARRGGGGLVEQLLLARHPGPGGGVRSGSGVRVAVRSAKRFKLNSTKRFYSLLYPKVKGKMVRSGPLK